MKMCACDRILLASRLNRAPCLSEVRIQPMLKGIGNHTKFTRESISLSDALGLERRETAVGKEAVEEREIKPPLELLSNS